MASSAWLCPWHCRDSLGLSGCWGPCHLLGSPHIVGLPVTFSCSSWQPLTAPSRCASASRRGASFVTVSFKRSDLLRRVTWRLCQKLLVLAQLCCRSTAASPVCVILVLGSPTLSLQCTGMEEQWGTGVPGGSCCAATEGKCCGAERGGSCSHTSHCTSPLGPIVLSGRWRLQMGLSHSHRPLPAEWSSMQN